MSLTTLIPLAVAASFIAMGLIAFVRPAYVMSYFGVATLTAELRNEVRAVYGGFGIALGVLLIATVTSADLACGVQLTAAVSLLGMAGGRIIGWSIESSGIWPRLFGVVELVAGVALLYCVSRIWPV